MPINSAHRQPRKKTCVDLFGYSGHRNPLASAATNFTGWMLWRLLVGLSALRTAGGANPQVEIITSQKQVQASPSGYSRTGTIAVGSYRESSNSEMFH
jgi:hypothetical protein